MFTTQNTMRNDYYFDDLDIENFFIDDERESGVFPTRAGQVSTRPQGITESTAPRPNPMQAPVQFNADGKLKDKLKTFAKSKLAKTILIAGAGAGIVIAAGPAIMAAIAPLLPAMKAILAKQGIKAKGAGDIFKKFHSTQVGELPKDAKGAEGAKLMLKGVLGFFKNAKEKRAAGTATPLEELALETADSTIKRISDGTLSVNEVVNDETPTPGRTRNSCRRSSAWSVLTHAMHSLGTKSTQTDGRLSHSEFSNGVVQFARSAVFEGG